jgi:hypothetical protein
LLGSVSELAREGSAISADREIQRLAQSAEPVGDPVTGLPTPPSLTDIQQQLETTGDPALVEVRPAIPVELTMPVESVGDVMAVFIAEPTMQFLGAARVRPTYIVNSDNERTPVNLTVLELAPPPPGGTVAIYLRSDPAMPTHCPPAAGERPVLEIPAADFVGDTRVSVNLVDLTFRLVDDFGISKSEPE